MKIFIYASHYNENSGGQIALHRLCHIINTINNHDCAFLVNWDLADPKKKSKLAFLKRILTGKKNFRIHPSWRTPLWISSKFPAKSIVIYPEIINGNPLRIKNVVRWLLHNPGFHTKQIDYSANELYYKFNSAIDDFYYEGSYLSQNELKVIFYPLGVYNNDVEMERDIECCHLIRKGKEKPPIHPKHSIQIDGLPHTEIAKIFKRSKRFISYDDYTAYSIFAALCGCESIVVPEKNCDLTAWYPNQEDRYGIAYGFDHVQLEWAAQTRHKVLEHVKNEFSKSESNVKTVLDEIRTHFKM